MSQKQKNGGRVLASVWKVEFWNVTRMGQYLSSGLLVTTATAVTGLTTLTSNFALLLLVHTSESTFACCHVYLLELVNPSSIVAYQPCHY